MVENGNKAAKIIFMRLGEIHPTLLKYCIESYVMAIKMGLSVLFWGEIVYFCENGV